MVLSELPEMVLRFVETVRVTQKKPHFNFNAFWPIAVLCKYSIQWLENFFLELHKTSLLSKDKFLWQTVLFITCSIIQKDGRHILMPFSPASRNFITTTLQLKNVRQINDLGWRPNYSFNLSLTLQVSQHGQGKLFGQPCGCQEHTRKKATRLHGCSCINEVGDKLHFSNRSNLRIILSH